MSETGDKTTPLLNRKVKSSKSSETMKIVF